MNWKRQIDQLRQKLTMVKMEDEPRGPGISLGYGVVDRDGGEEPRGVEIAGNGTVHGVIAGSEAGEGGFSAENPIHEARSTEVPASGADASTVVPTQLTIFFGGGVSVFDGIPAEKVVVRSAADLPIARRHSLQRFLQKRRDRLVSKNPYPALDMKTDAPRDNATPTIKEEYPTA